MPIGVFSSNIRHGKMSLTMADTLRHRQLDTSQYKPAIALIDELLGELKRLDDKMILTEVHLLESRVYRGIGNLAKAKACFSTLSPSLPSPNSRARRP